MLYYVLLIAFPLSYMSRRSSSKKNQLLGLLDLEADSLLFSDHGASNRLMGRLVGCTSASVVSPSSGSSSFRASSSQRMSSYQGSISLVGGRSLDGRSVDGRVSRRITHVATRSGVVLATFAAKGPKTVVGSPEKSSSNN